MDHGGLRVLSQRLRSCEICRLKVRQDSHRRFSDRRWCITFTSFQIWNDVLVDYLHRWWWWWFCQAVGEVQGVKPWPLGNTCGCPRNLGGRINNNNCSYFVQWSVTLNLTLKWYVLWFNTEKTQRNPWISAACAKCSISILFTCWLLHWGILLHCIFVANIIIISSPIS